MKIVSKRYFFRSRAARFGQIAFLPSNFSKSLRLSQILFKRGKQCALHGNCTKRSFQVMRSTFWPNRIFKRPISQNDHTALKIAFLPSNFSKSLRLSQILFKTGKQCAFHENCTKRYFQVIRSTFYPNRIFKRQSSQNRHTGLKCSSKRENSALSMKIVQNALFRSCAARFG